MTAASGRGSRTVGGFYFSPSADFERRRQRDVGVNALAFADWGLMPISDTFCAIPPSAHPN